MALPAGSRSRVARRTAVLIALGALSLSGCGSAAEGPAKAEPTSADSTAPTTSAPTDPTTSPVTTTPDPTLVSFATLSDRLLPTGDVPGLTATWRWSDGETGPAGSDAFGLCAKFDLASIGATEVVQRTYFPPVDTDDSAAEQIAEFPDATTTATALKVLKSWQKSCAAPGRKVGALTEVVDGAWYLVTRSSPNPDDTTFQQTGLVTSGTRIAVLTIDSVTAKFRYPSGNEPMVEMVRRAADRLR